MTCTSTPKITVIQNKHKVRSGRLIWYPAYSYSPGVLHMGLMTT